MISLKNKSKGFTIVELLIVIVVIGILATLVIVTFTGIQQKAHDSQRKTDIDAVDSHVEAFYAGDGHGYYPTAANLQDPVWVKANLKGLDPAALADPSTPASDITASATGIKDGASDSTHYGYTATPSGCDNSATPCTGFVIEAQLQASSDKYSKQSNT